MGILRHRPCARAFFRELENFSPRETTLLLHIYFLSNKSDTMVYSSYNDLLQNNLENLSKERELTDKLRDQIELLESELKQQVTKNEENSIKLKSEQNLIRHLDEQNKELTNENAKNSQFLQKMQTEKEQLQKQSENATSEISTKLKFSLYN